jgi:hypothetical protein
MRVNVSNNCEPLLNVDGNDSIPFAGFGIGNAVAANAHVYLGDNVRLLRFYNEAAAGTDKLEIGALTGTSKTALQIGWVDGRRSILEVGGLNVDAVFEGVIEKCPFNTSSTTIPTTSKLALSKTGTGKWTLPNVIIVDSTLTVNEGVLTLTGDVYLDDDEVTVNAGTLAIGGEFGIPYIGEASLSNIVVKSDATLKGLSGHQIHSVSTMIDPGGILAGGFNTDFSLMLDFDPMAETPAPSIWKPYINSFNVGDYDKITAGGDANVYGIIDITVNAATQGVAIPLIECTGNTDVAPVQILVNGVDITDNTESTPGAEFVWLPDTYELKSLIDKQGSRINTVLTNKVVKNIQYYDITGRPVTKNAQGFIIVKTIYTDDTTATQKTFVKQQ